MYRKPRIPTEVHRGSNTGACSRHVRNAVQLKWLRQGSHAQGGHPLYGHEEKVIRPRRAVVSPAMNKAVGRVAGIDGATTIAAFVHHGSIKADDLDVGAGFPHSSWLRTLRL